MSKSLKGRGFATKSDSKGVVPLDAEEREDIKSCVLVWNERFQKLEALITWKSTGESERFGWDFNAKADRKGQRILVGRINAVDGDYERPVLTDRPVTAVEQEEPAPQPQQKKRR
jgi:hypothetical protein